MLIKSGGHLEKGMRDTSLHRNRYAPLTDKTIISKKASQPMNRGAGCKLRHGLNRYTPLPEKGEEQEDRIY